MRETMAESGARGRSRVSRDLDRAAPVFLPVYRSHAAMSNVVKMPLLHPINYLRFPQRRPTALATVTLRQRDYRILLREKLTLPNRYLTIVYYLCTND